MFDLIQTQSRQTFLTKPCLFNYFQAREIRNSTMHASPMEITDKCLQNNKKVLVKMLNSLLSTKANDAIEDIEKVT